MQPSEKARNKFNHNMNYKAFADLNNISKRYPNGRTLQTRDEFLYGGKNKGDIKPDHPQKNDLYRRVGIIDSNSLDEVAVVKLDTKGNYKLDNYKNGKSRFKPFIHIKDSEGNFIKVDNEHFIENSKNRDISEEDVEFIKRKCLTDKETSRSLRYFNKKKIYQLKNSKKRNPTK